MRAKISRNFSSILGIGINKKILVIESDDWGLIRMPSKKSYYNLIKEGIVVDKCPYNTYDALETPEDLEQLRKFCQSFIDVNGNPLKITANFIMANPDFDKLSKSNFNHYHYRNLLETYKYYQGDDKTFIAIKNIVDENVLYPQLHGREHLQVNYWLEALRNNDLETMKAFNQGVWGHPTSYEKVHGVNFSSAFHINSQNDLDFSKHSVLEASNLFFETFGFKSDTFIAPRFIWPKELETTFFDAGVRALQGKIIQLKPSIEGKETKLKNTINWMGKSNSNGLEYLIRNVFFEPTQKPNFNWEFDAMKRIEIAFFWGKPAVISMHRLNFMGSFSEQNRKKNLERLGLLIKSVQKRYPEVEFLSSNELYRLVYEK